MASKSSTHLSNALMQKFISVEATRKRMDKLHFEGRIFRKDIEHVYEGIFLKAVTSFEAYLECLFIGVLHDKYRFPTRRMMARVSFSGKGIATDVVLNGQPYTDWLPLDKLERKAKIFYKEEGYPFTNLSPSERASLTQIGIIRNAIAHKSTHSDDTFKRKIINSSAGLPDENKTPAGFLRYVYRSGPDQTKFENYLMELITIATKIATSN